MRSVDVLSFGQWFALMCLFSCKVFSYKRPPLPDPIICPTWGGGNFTVLNSCQNLKGTSKNLHQGRVRYACPCLCILGWENEKNTSKKTLTMQKLKNGIIFQILTGSCEKGLGKYIYFDFVIWAQKMTTKPCHWYHFLQCEVLEVPFRVHFI